MRRAAVTRCESSRRHIQRSNGPWLLIGIMGGQVRTSPCCWERRVYANDIVVVGDNESELMKLIRSLPKDS